MDTTDPPATPPTILMPRVLAATDVQVGGRRFQLWRVAAATRRVIEGLVGTDLDEATLAARADELEAVAATFDHDGPRSGYDGISEATLAGGDPSAFFDHSPFIGRANPLSPPITLEVHDQMIRGTATFGSAYEGPPGCVHGGYVAAAFDEVLGAAQTFSGAPGMTARLIVNYRKPTPLHAELTFEGRFVRMEGRKVFTEGRVLAGDLVTAEAEGLFISIGSDQFKALRDERDARLRPGS